MLSEAHGPVAESVTNKPKSLMSAQAADRIRLYRFMPAKWAIKSIETRELRVGRLVELNDPFEFVPGFDGLRSDVSPDAVRKIMREGQTDINSTIGLLCFSSAYREPTLWSHYAESHRGVVLGLDVHPDPTVDKVEYLPNRPRIHPGTPLDSPVWKNVLIKTITTKAPGWQAESEHRRLVRLAGCRCEAGDYFVPMTDKNLDETFALAEVVLGCRCQLEENYVCQTLQQSGFTDVRVLRAKPSVDTFETICD